MNEGLLVFMIAAYPNHRTAKVILKPVMDVSVLFFRTEFTDVSGYTDKVIILFNFIKYSSDLLKR